MLLIATLAVMDVLAVGAEIATMLGGVSVAITAFVWIRKQWTDRRDLKAATALRNWTGYIEIGGINTWHVQLMEDPSEPSARVILDVVNEDGEPDPNWAHNLRQRVIGDGILARVPTPEEYDFLKALHKERGYGKGRLVR